MELEDPRLDEHGLQEGPEAVEAAIVLVAMTEIRMKERTTAEWLEAFDAAGVPAGPFNTAVEMVDDPQVLANDMVMDQVHPAAGSVRMLGPVLRPVGHEPVRPRPSPLLGEHDEEVLTELGYGQEEIDRLRAGGIIR